MPNVELYVGLKIPDTTAVTTFHTIEKMGYKINKVKREIYYKFNIDGNKEKFINKISKVDVLVNANKNKFRTELEKEDSASTILVQDLDDDCKSLLTTLKQRLGLKEIKTMEKGVLWTLYCDKETAVKITKELLTNEHYQKFEVVN